MGKERWILKIVDSVNEGSIKEREVFATVVLRELSWIRPVAWRAEHQRTIPAAFRKELIKGIELINKLAQEENQLTTKDRVFNKMPCCDLPSGSRILAISDLSKYLQEFDRYLESLEPVSGDSRAIAQRMIANMLAALYLEHFHKLPKFRRRADLIEPSDFDRVCDVVSDLLSELNLLVDIGKINDTAKREAVKKLRSIPPDKVAKFRYRFPLESCGPRLLNPKKSRPISLK